MPHHHYHNLQRRVTLGPINQSNQANVPIIIIITRKCQNQCNAKQEESTSDPLYSKLTQNQVKIQLWKKDLPQLPPTQI